jgi:hypothetical protein
MVTYVSAAVNGSSATLTPTGSSIKGMDGTNAGDFLLTVFVATETDNGVVTGVTFDGNAMTSRGSVQNSGATPDINISCWTIPVTQTDPVGNIVATFTGSIGIAQTVSFIIMRLYDVASVGTAGSAQGNGTGNAVSPSIDVTEGGLIVGMNIRATDTQTNTWTGLTEISDRDSGPSNMSVAARWLCTAETGRTVQAVGSGSGQYATLAVPFNA